jgi:glycosyltransferase involved in cell wall biosynthesis
MPARFLFLHPEGFGQFGRLAAHLARRPGARVMLLSRKPADPISGVRTVRYALRRAPSPATHPYARWTEHAALAGQAALRACLSLRARGFVPQVVIAHPGWGDALFLREAFPDARIILYCEYFWRASGADVGFADESGTDMDARCALRLRNSPLLASLEAADALYAPTRWQRDLHPAWLHDRITVIHDGIDTQHAQPDQAARFVLPDGAVLTARDEVATYVARGLEPQRGFPQLMRALPDLLARRPALRVVICGDDRFTYGRPPDRFATWRQAMLAELGPLPRVHFVGTLAYQAYLSLLRISSLHLYLSVPFVLSWSFCEAMAAGCLVLGSDTAPVREFIDDGRNGFLVEMREPAAIAHRAAELLAARGNFARQRAAARATITARCALPDCLAVQEALIGLPVCA